MSVIAEGTRKRTVHSPLNSPDVTDNAHDGKIRSESKSGKELSSCMILFIVGGVSIIGVITLSLFWEKLAGRNNHMIINNKIQLPHEFDQGAAWFDKRHIHDILDDIHIPADKTERKQTSGDAPKKAADKKTPPPSNSKNGKEGPSSKDRHVPSENNKNGNARVDKPTPAKGTPSDTNKAENKGKTPPSKMVPPAASGKDEPAKKSQPSKPLPSNNINSVKKETGPPGAEESPGKDKTEQGSRVATPKIVTNDAAADKKTPPSSNSKNAKEGPSSKDRDVPSENNKNGNARVDKPPPAKGTPPPSDNNKAENKEKTPPSKMVPPATSGKDEPAKKSQPSKRVPSNNINSVKNENAPPVAKESPGKDKIEQGSRVPTPKIVTNDVRDKQDHKSSEKENRVKKETSSTETKEPPAKEKEQQVLRGPNPKKVTNDTDKTKGKKDQKLSETKEKAKSKESVTKDINEGIKANNGKSKIAVKNSRDESQEKKNSRNVKPANKNGGKVDPK